MAVGKAGLHPGGVILVVNGGGIYFETQSGLQDAPITRVDTSNNIIIGNDTLSGSSEENDLIFAVQTGKTFHWTINGVEKAKMDSSGNWTFSPLSGTGNGFACLDTNGKLYRSATACQ